VSRWHVSVLLTDPPHPYASNARLDVEAETTDEIYDLVARRYPLRGLRVTRAHPIACEFRPSNDALSTLESTEDQA